MGAIHHSLERGYIDIVNKASFHLLESIGYRDSCAALQLLALYQVVERFLLEKKFTENQKKKC